MRTIFLTVSLLLFSIASLAQPKIEIVGGESFDFGNLVKGEKAERKVAIKNIGTELLVIERVQASCGCTATLLEEKNVSPGKATSISIGFDSKNFIGSVHKNVMLLTNDPNAATTTITFKAFVKEALVAVPPHIAFPLGTVDSTMTSATTLKNMSEETINILDVTANSPGATFDVKKKSLAPGESTQLAVTFTPSRIGYINHDVVVKTSHPKQTELAMKLVCNVLRPASPRTTGQK